MAALGSSGHRAIIAEVVENYRADDRIQAVAVFGSVATGDWHELSDVDLDIVVCDGIVMRPADEIAALFGPRAAITLVRTDSADVVLDSLEEVSLRWHGLASTSPHISATVRVADGELSDADVAAAGEANRARCDEEHFLDALVRDAIGASKLLARGRPWDASAAIERMRRALRDLRGRRDALRLDPADTAGALAAAIAEAQASFDLGTRRRALLDQIGASAPASGDSPRPGGASVPG
ncbi:MAG TPA: nucleotidyltransferase domain-containing protein [Streptosporangiaceae bacterium]|jgi:hypothetical protein